MKLSKLITFIGSVSLIPVITGYGMYTWYTDNKIKTPYDILVSLMVSSLMSYIMVKAYENTYKE